MSRIIYNYRTVEVDDDIELIQTAVYRTESLPWVYENVANLIDGLFSRIPGLRRLESLDWKNALYKLIYVKQMSQGQLAYAGQQQPDHLASIGFGRQSSVVGYLVASTKAFLGHCYRVFKSRRKSLMSAGAWKGRKIVYICGAPTDLWYFDNILRPFYRDMVVYVPVEFAQRWDAEHIAKLEAEGISVVFEKSRFPRLYFTLLSPFRFSSKERWLLTHFLTAVYRARGTITSMEELLKRGPKLVMFNAGENNYWANIICQIARRHGCKSLNIMNGLKSGEPSDWGVEFDRWVVWDEKMRSLLVERGDIPFEVLEPIGHPAAVDISSDEMKASPSTVCLEGVSKFIPIFGRGDLDIVKIVMDRVQELARANPEWRFAYRPHPTDDSRILSSVDPDLVTIVGHDANDAKTELYRLLYAADLVVVFGSTVGMEASWLGVPVISIEPWTRSHLYNVDDDNVIHCRTLGEFEQAFGSLMSQDRGVRSTKGLPSSEVTERYIDCIRSMTC